MSNPPSVPFSDQQLAAIKELTIERLFRLDGKVAVLTDIGGTGSGEIGALLASVGARVFLADRDEARAQAMADAIKANGGQAEAVVCDIEDEASVVAAFEKIAKAAGGLDILVNCAGLLVRLPFVDLTLEHLDASLTANLRTTFLCMREALKHMLAAGRGGRMINITTIGALAPVLHGNAAYGAARLAVTALGRGLAFDHAKDGVLVNTIYCGGMADKVPFHPDTVAREAELNAWGGSIRQPGRMPLGPVKWPDLAGAVLYLASPAGGNITAQGISLDGGFLTS